MLWWILLPCPSLMGSLDVIIIGPFFSWSFCLFPSSSKDVKGFYVRVIIFNLDMWNFTLDVTFTFCTCSSLLAQAYCFTTCFKGSSDGDLPHHKIPFQWSFLGISWSTLNSQNWLSLTELLISEVIFNYSISSNRKPELPLIKRSSTPRFSDYDLALIIKK